MWDDDYSIPHRTKILLPPIRLPSIVGSPSQTVLLSRRQRFFSTKAFHPQSPRLLWYFSCWNCAEGIWRHRWILSNCLAATFGSWRHPLNVFEISQNRSIAQSKSPLIHRFFGVEPRSLCSEPSCLWWRIRSNTRDFVVVTCFDIPMDYTHSYQDKLCS